MKIELKELKGCGRELRIEVEKEKVEKEFKTIYSNLGREAKIPGFRPGKAPINVIKTHFGEGIKNEVFDKLVPPSSAKAMEEKGLSSIITPLISEVNLREDALSWKLYLEVTPDVNLGNYKGLVIKKEKRTVQEEEVNKTLENWAKNDPKIKQETFNLKQRDGLKAGIRKQLESEDSLKEKREEEKEILKLLRENSSLEIPPAFLNRHLDGLIKENLSRMDLKGKNKEEIKKIIDELRERLRQQAEEDVKSFFILEEIARKEKIGISENELNEAIANIAKLNKEKPEELRKKLEKNERLEELQNQLKQNKVLDFVKKRAKIIWKPEKKVILAK